MQIQKSKSIFKEHRLAFQTAGLPEAPLPLGVAAPGTAESIAKMGEAQSPEVLTQLTNAAEGDVITGTRGALHMPPEGLKQFFEQTGLNPELASQLGINVLYGLGVVAGVALVIGAARFAYKKVTDPATGIV